MEINSELFYLLGSIFLCIWLLIVFGKIQTKNEKEAEKRWIEFVNSCGGNLYKRSWMAMNKETGLLEGGMSIIPYKEAKAKGLVPRSVIRGSDNGFFTNIIISGDVGSSGGCSGDAGGGDC